MSLEYVRNTYGVPAEIGRRVVVEVDEYESSGFVCFSVDGKTGSAEGQTLFWSKPVFDPPQRPKRKVKKVVEGWVNIFNDSRGMMLHGTREAAERFAACGFPIACVHMTGEYEVKE